MMSEAKERSINLWCNILLASIAFIVIISLFMFVPPQVSVSYFNLILFGGPNYPDTMTTDGVTYAGFLYAVLGCVMIGWTVPLFYLANGPLRAGSRTAWRVIALSIGLWFVIDSGVSLALGFWQNAVSNVSLMLIIALPLMMIRPHLGAD